MRASPMPKRKQGREDEDKKEKDYLLLLNKAERREPKIKDFATYLGVTRLG